jgi:superfamily II DNA or RNA helicase
LQRGLGRRDHDQQIILGTIQTLFRDSHLLGRRGLLLIDEMQLVAREGEAMYLTLIDTLRVRAPAPRKHEHRAAAGDERGERGGRE